MKEVSREEVETAVNSIKEIQDSLNSETLTAKTNTLNSIIALLSECWNTASGKEKQQRLKEIIDTDYIDFMKITNAFYKVKESTISYTTVTQHRSYH